MSAPLQKGTEVIAGEPPHFSRRFLAAISSVPLRIATLQTSCLWPGVAVTYAKSSPSAAISRAGTEIVQTRYTCCGISGQKLARVAGNASADH